MSRVIKFRAWDSLRSEFYKAWENDGASPYIGFHLFGECTLLCPPRIEDLQHLVVDQFTGMLDKNGVEIYEGDIIETPYDFPVSEYSSYSGSTIGLYRGAVGYRPSCGYYQKQVIRQEHDGDDHKAWIKNKILHRIIQSRCRVIGNIHQNPELLK